MKLYKILFAGLIIIIFCYIWGKFEYKKGFIDGENNAIKLTKEALEKQGIYLNIIKNK